MRTCGQGRPAPASTQAGRQCQLPPAEGDLDRRMHKCCCASRPRILGLGSRRGGWRTRGVSQAWVPWGHREVANPRPPPRHDPRWDAEEMDAEDGMHPFPFSLQKTQVQAQPCLGGLASPAAQQHAFLSLASGPVGDRPSGRGEAPSPREFPAQPEREEPPTIWTATLRQSGSVASRGHCAPRWLILHVPPGLGSQRPAGAGTRPAPHPPCPAAVPRGCSLRACDSLANPPPLVSRLHVCNPRGTCVSHPSTHAQSHPWDPLLHLKMGPGSALIPR